MKVGFYLSGSDGLCRVDSRVLDTAADAMNVVGASLVDTLDIKGKPFDGVFVTTSLKILGAEAKLALHSILCLKSVSRKVYAFFMGGVCRQGCIHYKQA